MVRDPLREGRLGTKRPTGVVEFLSSMKADRMIAEADILVDIAHLLMLRRQGIVDGKTAETLLPALLDLYDEGIPEEAFDDRFEDIHAGIEAYLIERAGPDIGGRLHIGRSRNDEVATCIRIRLRTLLLEQMEALLQLRRVILDMAAEHRESIMPGFTHLQHAQPTTLAHHLLAYEQAFGRDFSRLQGSLERVNRCPLGAAALASTGYPIDREYTSEILGFSAPLQNTMDAVSARDDMLEAIAISAISMSTVSRLAEELVLWSTGFVQFATLDDAYSSTSSIMPQKKNPDVAEIMRAKAGTVSGALMSALSIMKGLPLSYDRDLQELTPHLWTAVLETKRAYMLLAEMLATTTFHTERMAEEAGKGFSTATELADIIVREFGISFRTAHGIVGRAVRKGSLSLETVEEAAEEMASLSLRDLGLSEKMIEEALDPRYSIGVRNVPGGPAPSAVDTHREMRGTALDADGDWWEHFEADLDRAITRLVLAARELVP
jgi:argininosuccinate lyase